MALPEGVDFFIRGNAFENWRIAGMFSDPNDFRTTILTGAFSVVFLRFGVRLLDLKHQGTHVVWRTSLLFCNLNRGESLPTVAMSPVVVK